MKEIILIPIFLTLFMGFSLQLVDIAQSSSEKTLLFAQDMSNAMDCAVLGKNLSLCSPELFERDFTKELNQTNNLAKEIKQKASEIIGLEKSQNQININGTIYKIIETNKLN